MTTVVVTRPRADYGHSENRAEDIRSQTKRIPVVDNNVFRNK